jgi:hypothetical protein
VKTPFPLQPALTAIALAFSNRVLIADRVLPRIPVGTQEFKWLRHNLAEGFTVPDTKVGRTSAPNRVEFTATEEAGACYDQALDDLIPQADLENRPPNFDPEAHAAEYLTNLILLDREVRVAGKVLNPANYGAANKVTLAGTSQWSHADSNPVAAILAQFDAMVMRPNRMVIGRPVYTALRQHPKVIAAAFPNGGNAGTGGIVGRAAIEDLLEVELIVGEAFVNTARKGQAVNLSRVWGKSALAYYSDGVAQTTKQMQFGFTAQWGGRIAGSIEDRDAGMRGGRRIRVGESVGEIIATPDVAYLWQAAVA